MLLRELLSYPSLHSKPFVSPTHSPPTILVPPDSYVTFLDFSFVHHVFTTHSSVAIANSSNISPSVFLVPNPLPPCTFSKPSAKVPTRLLKSPHTTSSSSLLMPDISFLSCAKNSSFSSICLPTWGEYTETTFRIILPTASLKDNSLLVTLLTPTTCSNHFSDIITPTPAKPGSQPLQHSLYLAPSTTNVLVFPPFQRVSCK